MGIVLATGLEFELRGKKYRIQKMLGPNLAEAKNFTDSLDVLTLTSNDVTALVSRGELKFLNHSERPVPFIDFSHLSDEKRKDTIRKYEYVAKVLEMTRKEQTKTLVESAISLTAKKLGETSIPNISTVYRWKKKFISSGSDIKALVKNDASKGWKISKLDFDVNLIIEEIIQEKYKRSRWFTVKDLDSAVKIEIDQRNEMRKGITKPLQYPNIKTLRNRVKKIDNYDLIQSRFGKEAAERMYRYIGHKEKPTRPLAVCEIDHTILDLFVLKRENNIPMGRPTITVMMDEFSRCVCGFYLGFDPAGYLPVMYCLNHAMSPKNYVTKIYPEVENSWNCTGVPEVLVVDNGPEFINKSLEDACYQLNTKLIFSPPRKPQFKGVIERFFGTQNTSFLHSIPGATFSDKRSRKDQLLRYGYNPEKDAAIYFDDLVKLLHIFYLDYYHQKPHKGLNNRIPAKVWEEGVSEHPITVPQSTNDLRAILGMIEERTLTPRGIEWKGLIYNSHELTPMRVRILGQKVTFKYDPSDISAIFVHDKTMGEYIRVPALDQKYTNNLSLWEHRVILRNAKEDESKVDAGALARAQMKIRNIVEKNLSKANTSSRKKVSRYENQRFKPPTEATQTSIASSINSPGIEYPANFSVDDYGIGDFDSSLSEQGTDSQDAFVKKEVKDTDSGYKSQKNMPEEMELEVFEVDETD
jgi:putative transposase